MNQLMANDDEQLTELLGRLREGESRVEAPAHVRSTVMAAWDSGSREHLPRRSGEAAKASLWRGVAALAAGVVLAVTLTRLGGELRGGLAPASVPQASSATLHLVGEPIADGEAVRVVRMRMAPAMLTSLGLRSTAGELAESVDVDVIVGEDGVARAIRIGM